MRFHSRSGSPTLAVRRGRRKPIPRNGLSGAADFDQTFVPSIQPVDGFTMNAALKYLPYRSFPLYLGQLDELRHNSANYRGRYIVQPFGLPTITGGDTYETTQPLHPGTVLWGYSFTALDGTTVADWTVNITDICTQEVYFDQEMVANALRPSGATNLYPVLMEPRTLDGDGEVLLRIRITNKDADTDARCQLVIHAAEPCWVMGYGYGPMPVTPFGGTR